MTANVGRSGPSREAAVVAITAIALLMFVGIGSSVLSAVARQVSGDQAQIDRTMMIALFLNIALILLGWRRHRDLIRALRPDAAAEARAREIASRDPLTGLLNRRGLAEDGATMLGSARRRDKAVAMIMFDLDHFKSVNDLHGHAVGDALLSRIAGEFAEALPSTALVARLGGDEFACCVVFDPRHPDTVDRIAERLVSRLGQPFRVEGQHLHLSASIGLARSDFEESSIDGLMRAADIAMYAAKGAGRNRYVWFDRAMEQALRSRSELEAGLREAIPRNQVVPCFEQQIDLNSGSLTGFEVLARWEHPTRGHIGPDRFIPIAEECGLIADLSLSIMQQAFVAARDWHPDLTLSVNISPVQLRDAWLPQKIIKLLTETGFPAHRLEIEITESALFDNLALAQSIVGSLKNQGICIALDDFGTGYSSLAHLRALPFDRIKVDKSFVTSIVDNPESAAIVTAIARLGDSLNLPVTAEGIEDQAIADRLRAMGCAKGQGYLYGKPLTVANARRLLAERRMLANQTLMPVPTSRRQAG